MGAWQPVNVIPTAGPNGPGVNWAGPAGAPFDFDIRVDDGEQGGTWLGQIRTEPDSDDVVATFNAPTFGAPDADNKVTATFAVATTALEPDVCYVYAVAQDQGDGFEPRVSGTLAPTIPTARP